jgi:hypothetical protein
MSQQRDGQENVTREKQYGFTPRGNDVPLLDVRILYHLSERIWSAQTFSALSQHDFFSQLPQKSTFPRRGKLNRQISSSPSYYTV